MYSVVTNIDYPLNFVPTVNDYVFVNVSDPKLILIYAIQTIIMMFL